MFLCLFFLCSFIWLNLRTKLSRSIFIAADLEKYGETSRGHGCPGCARANMLKWLHCKWKPSLIKPLIMVWYGWISKHPGRELWFILFIQMNAYNQKLQSVTKLCPAGPFPITQPFCIGCQCCGFTAQMTTAHWSPLRMAQPVLHQRIHLLQIKAGFGLVCDLLTDRPAVLAGQQHWVGNAECLTTHQGKYLSTWHTWAKGFLLIKSHLEEMTSTRLLCLSICSSLPDLFCVWKLNS